MTKLRTVCDFQIVFVLAAKDFHFISTNNQKNNFKQYKNNFKKVELVTKMEAQDNCERDLTMETFLWKRASILAYIDVEGYSLQKLCINMLSDTINAEERPYTLDSQSWDKEESELTFLSKLMRDSVYRSSTGKITHIELSLRVTTHYTWRSMSHKIPLEIGNFPFLLVLNLSNSDISGNIPLSIGNLQSLKKLQLSDNKLEGNIPTSISKLCKLTLLDLSNNRLSGTIPSELGALTNLSQLYLNNNKLTGSIPSTLVQLTKLQRFQCCNNKIEKQLPLELHSLQSLQHLDIRNTLISGQITLGILQSFDVYYEYRNYRRIEYGETS